MRIRTGMVPRCRVGFFLAMAVMVVTAAGLCGACRSGESGPTKDQCEKIRDHEISLQLANYSFAGLDKNAAEAERAKHHKAMVAAIGPQLIDECLSATHAQNRCVLEATTARARSVCRDHKLPHASTIGTVQENAPISKR